MSPSSSAPPSQPPRLVAFTSPSELGPFLALPHRLYADDPAWIAPLDFEQRQRFSPKSHFLSHARWQGWVVMRGDTPVGRITAQIDDLEQQEGLGYFGMFEAEDDAEVVQLLFRAAESWLAENGVSRVRGPFNLHINEEVGLLVDGFDTPPYILMGHALPRYDAALQSAGYQAAKDVLAYKLPTDFSPPTVMTRLAERASKRVKVRSFRRSEVEAEAEVMRGIFNDAWANNWGFVPLDATDWLDTVKTLIKLMPDDYVQIAEVDGEPAAFIVALPNVNEAARDLRGRLLPFGWLKLLWRLKVSGLKTARVPLLGVTQAYQHSRIGPTLAFMMTDAVRKALHARGVREVELGWILEDNDGMRNVTETIGGKAYKRYRIYEKGL